MRRLLAAILCALTLPVAAAELRIGYLSLDKDPRYTPSRAEARISPEPYGNALAGAELGLADTGFAAQAAGLAVSLDARSGADANTLAAAATDMATRDPVILLDLPATLVAAVTPALANVLAINVSAPEDSLRCLPGLLHSFPSDRMAMDGLAQLLATRNWTHVLVLSGPLPRDKELSAAFSASAARYRLQVVDTREFTLAADPANRDLHDPLLLTGGLDYDAIYVADSDRQFGPFLPYATERPRPVIGSDGLVPLAWHWAFDLFGAPQVNGRFVRAAHRHMDEADWSAWMAVKAVVAAAAKAGTSPGDLRAALASDTIGVDGSKGVAMNFRSWDGQLRMPILLATPDAVIATAPFPAFQHQSNVLDTLGTDAAELQCP